MFGKSGTVGAWQDSQARSARIQSGEVFAMIPSVPLSDTPSFEKARVAKKNIFRRRSGE